MISTFLVSLVATAQSTMTCSEGFTLQGKTCAKSYREAAKFHCEDGVLFKDLCTFKSEPTTKCPAGSSMREGICAGSTPIAQIKRDAPAGFADSGVNYVKNIPRELKQICPFGEFDHIAQLCTVEKNLPPKVKTFCPPGSVEDGKGCAMTIPLELAPVCEQGALIDGSCVFTNQEAPMDMGEYCPADSVPNGDECIRQMPGHVISSCPEGEPVMGQCEIVLTKKIAARPECPKGYEKHGERCRMKRAGYAVDSCPIGSTSDGVDCVTYASATKLKSEPVCPETYQPSEGKDGCYKTEIYDCTPPTVGKDGVRGATTQTVAQTCERKEYVDAIVEESCPESFEETEGACTKKNTVEKASVCNLDSSSYIEENCFDYVYKSPFMRTSCDAPFAMKNGVCGKVLQVPAKKVCAETGSTDVDACFATQSVALLKEVGCPVGFSLNEGICYQEISAQPKMVCEDQFKPAEQCSMIHRVEPVVRPICPPGSIQDPASPLVCVQKTTFEPVSICEDGSAAEDCTTAVELPYTYQCPFGSIDTETGCEKINAYEALEFCEDGQMLVNGACVHTLPAISNCPSGTQTVRGFCIGQVTEEPVVEYMTRCIGKGCEESI